MRDRHEVFGWVADERASQDRKWGACRQQPDSLWLTILVEEVGEVANAMLDATSVPELNAHLREELVQVAAVAVSWLESRDW